MYIKYFCENTNNCEINKCIDVSPPSSYCDGNYETPQFCLGVNGEPLYPDKCSGVN